jgi:hypothetical protein
MRHQLFGQVGRTHRKKIPSAANEVLGLGWVSATNWDMGNRGLVSPLPPSVPVIGDGAQVSVSRQAKPKFESGTLLARIPCAPLPALVPCPHPLLCHPHPFPSREAGAAQEQPPVDDLTRLTCAKSWAEV